MNATKVSTALPRKHATFGGSRRRPATPPRAAVKAQASVKALLFDCDGVILESEELHRVAYNAAFENFDVKCSGSRVIWTEEFYDILQNTVGGGKPKMRWYFGQNGWPTSSVVPGVPEDEESQAVLIDTLQDWKSQYYQDLIGSGTVKARPGVLRVMDEARAAGLLVGVCSAATKSSAEFTVRSLLGADRFAALDLFMAGDDVSKKKPDPQIYLTAAERLGVDVSECVVIEDSMVGFQAARAANMRCIITYTASTAKEPFTGAERVICELGDNPAQLTVAELLQGLTVTAA